MQQLPIFIQKPLTKNPLYYTTQPVVNSTTGNKSQSPPEVQPEQQPTTSQLQPNGNGNKSEFVTYSVQTVA